MRKIPPSTWRLESVASMTWEETLVESSSTGGDTIHIYGVGDSGTIRVTSGVHNESGSNWANTDKSASTSGTKRSLRTSSTTSSSSVKGYVDYCI